MPSSDRTTADPVRPGLRFAPKEQPLPVTTPLRQEAYLRGEKGIDYGAFADPSPAGGQKSSLEKPGFSQTLTLDQEHHQRKC